MRKVKKKWAERKYGRDLGLGLDSGSYLTNLRFADDILLVARSLPQIKQMIADVSAECEKAGLELHPDKTQIQHNGIGYGSRVKTATVGSMVIEFLDPMTSNMYLGKALCLRNVHDAELEHRQKKAWAKFATFKHELTDKAVPLHLRLKLFHSVITPTALYGCSSWVMTSTRTAKLRGTQLKMLRAMLGRQRIYTSDGEIETWVEWIQRVTDEARRVADENKIPDWRNVYTTRLRSLQARLQQMESYRWAKRVLEWMPTGFRSRGHPLTRWSEQLSPSGA